MAELNARPEKEVEVDGETFTIRKYPATKGIRFQKYLLKVGGSAYIQSQSEDATIADVINKVLENLDDIDESIIKEMITFAVVHPQMSDAKFETHFAGRTVTMFKLLKEIVFYNFDDVFTILGLGEIPEEDQQ